LCLSEGVRVPSTIQSASRWVLRRHLPRRHNLVDDIAQAMHIGTELIRSMAQLAVARCSLGTFPSQRPTGPCPVPRPSTRHWQHHSCEAAAPGTLAFAPSELALGCTAKHCRCLVMQSDGCWPTKLLPLTRTAGSQKRAPELEKSIECRTAGRLYFRLRLSATVSFAALNEDPDQPSAYVRKSVNTNARGAA
jgi:hypothetical protein